MDKGEVFTSLEAEEQVRLILNQVGWMDHCPELRPMPYPLLALRKALEMTPFIRQQLLGQRNFSYRLAQPSVRKPKPEVYLARWQTGQQQGWDEAYFHQPPSWTEGVLANCRK